MEPKILQKIDEDESNLPSLKNVNEKIKQLFGLGFIMRNTQYQSAEIEYRTQLAFKPKFFLNSMQEALKKIKNKMDGENEIHEKAKTNNYQCTSYQCKINGRQFTKLQEQEIKRKEKQQNRLNRVECPICSKSNVLQKIQKKHEDTEFELQYNMINELVKEAEYLKLQSDPRNGDEDYLERELRAMRQIYNEKINYQNEQFIQSTIQDDNMYDKRVIFQTKQLELHEQEKLKKKKLQQLQIGNNLDSILKKKGPVFKAPRDYSGGMTGNQIPEWLEDVYKRADDILKRE